MEIIEKIQRLKERRNAVILAHNYQREEVQAIADYTGDSLGLSRKASMTDADVIVFCGVRFMAETSSILYPDKTVLMPELNAGCPMADMITAEGLKEVKRCHKGALTVGYVNTTAEVKAEVDICCTSANAVDVVNSIKDDCEIIFVPDKYLGLYTAIKTGRTLLLWSGYCPTHIRILEEDVKKQKREHPDAEVLVHPECTPPVRERADRVLSTEGICRYAQTSDAYEFIIGTETGILYRLEKENPLKRFYPASGRAVCPNMKLTTLEKVFWALDEMKHEIRVPENIRTRAKLAVDRMLEAV